MIICNGETVAARWTSVTGGPVAWFSVIFNGETAADPRDGMAALMGRRAAVR